MGSFVSKRELGLLEVSDDQSRLSSPLSVAAVTKRCLPRELDPRSPSAGIDRTPIAVLAPQATVADPRSPSVGIVRTPIVCIQPESGKASMDILPSVEDGDSELPCPSPVPQFPHLDNSQVSQDVSVSAPLCSGSPKSAVNSESTAADEKPVKNNVSYALSPASNKLFGSATSPSQRSPLGPRNFMAPQDSSTPRKIIQRKQSAHVEKLRAGDLVLTKRQLQPLQSSCDKENLQ